jgi:hypothetical protein
MHIESSPDRFCSRRYACYLTDKVTDLTLTADAAPDTYDAAKRHPPCNKV